MKTYRRIVEAGAGCGKTESLVRHYLGALAEGLDPRDIIVLTFTEDAAREMKERLLRRLEASEDPVTFDLVRTDGRLSTFHALCYRLVKPHLKRLGYEGQADIMKPDVARLLRYHDLLEHLSRSDQIKELGRVSDVEKLADLGSRNWFRFRDAAAGAMANLGPSAFETEMRERLETFRRNSSRLLEALFRQFPEARDDETLWPALFWLGLEGKTERLEEMDFRRGRKMADAFPEAAQNARAYKEFFEKNFGLAVAAESEGREQAGQTLVLQFLCESIQTLPKYLDYDALEFEVQALLREDRAQNARRETTGLCRLLIVDEFQDTNPTQMTILRLLSGEGTSWYFVGDPKQSIYAFRKADVSIFLGLKKELELQSLSRNFRSDAPLVQFVNRVQEKLFDASCQHDPEAQVLECHNGERPGVPVALRLFEVEDVALIWSTFTSDRAARLREWAARPEATPPTEAVLFLSWKSLYAFSERMNQAGMTCDIGGARNDLDHPLTDIFAEYLLNYRGDYRYGAETFAHWCGEPAQSPPEAHGTRHGGRRPSDELASFCAQIRPARWSGGNAWTVAMERFLRAPSGRFREVLSARDLAFFLKRERRRLEVPWPPYFGDSGQTGRIKLMTIHGSKGLEFDFVYMPDLFDRDRKAGMDSIDDEHRTLFNLQMQGTRGERVPALEFSVRRHLEQMRLQAERKRLLYVALTRAKRGLSMYLRPPALAGKTKPSALSVLGLPEARATFWNEVLRALKTENGFADLEAEGALRYEVVFAPPAATDAPVLPARREENWDLPVSRSPATEREPVRLTPEPFEPAPGWEVCFPVNTPLTPD